jgi:small subunit ribosomal protein S8
MMTDPLGDMLTRIRNASRAGHPGTQCPSSRLKLAVARAIKDEGFLDRVEVEGKGGKPELQIDIRYGDDGAPILDGLRRISRPSRRVYVGAAEIPKVRNGLGVAILSTPKGILSDRAAREAKVGGEILCEVW